MNNVTVLSRWILKVKKKKWMYLTIGSGIGERYTQSNNN